MLVYTQIYAYIGAFWLAFGSTSATLSFWYLTCICNKISNCLICTKTVLQQLLLYLNLAIYLHYKTHSHTIETVTKSSKLPKNSKHSLQHFYKSAATITCKFKYKNSINQKCNSLLQHIALQFALQYLPFTLLC